MQIIPVIDLKDGVVVRGVAGRRELYRPVESVLGCDATPNSVADAFVSRLGFQSVYVADLDAIAGAEPNWAAYQAITSTGLRPMVDAGTNCVERTSGFVDDSADGGWCGGVVVGLESLRSERDLLALCAAIGPERAVFSLDLRNGKPLTEISTWNEAEPIELVDAAVSAGFGRLIVLDLASVGVGQGVSVRTLCASIRSRHPQLEMISGGGVRDQRDLAELAAAGCDAALVASALHDGRLSKQDLSGFV
ncbi:MAG: HisA/HisF-related TIM barrel protein [Planctomycetota bacterium]|nr:HisA/HisF-related TIM barrel protein [Planctomycetota bacterium]